MKENAYFKGETKEENFILRYYVTSSGKINELTGYFEWGIRVDKYEKGVITESEEIKNISPDFKRVSDMAEILLKNSVTPSGLFYVVSDMVSLTF